MERRKSQSRGPTKPRKRPKVDLAKTALGEVPEKRGLKQPPAKTKTGKGAAAPSGGGQRELAVNVKTAKRRRHSSTLWLQRQLNDPYVARAKAEGYRSRAAYKLIELNERFGLIKPGARVVDLGAAPGGWSQVAAKAGAAKVVGIDYLGMDPVPGADILEMDFLDAQAPARLKALLGGEADVVLSDMAAPTTGHKPTDHLRVVALAEAALAFAVDVLAPGGSFVCKVFQGGAEGELLASLKRNFATVKHAKPKASRAESPEMYVAATGFRGRA
ncbi:RlmE family RNA methyltransferase [Amphiplicatus metriothermophilus]|uniref:Ribosomal RNA large subunit methyltransferase E n=1 Tax=Amphiplicatus metriothermophilus TaxID=1519374 RepID=A0A239Q0Q7_9PROT|nr:RlmE family RNA methyltransferase [Amphiplicatus metriothermophilus]MBB5519733.1 23S rRNA (uridine2552-2'-O)-methyltransferase [Amphiplicatus metriothermophilus]SNT75928.1 23S rRNA Um-2552 2'-O-methyltransferase [Amphiplicatus metriothermophilus]